MIIGDVVVVDGKPGLSFICHKVSFFVKTVDIIKSEIDIAFTVVIEQIEVERVDEVPLLLGKGHDCLSLLIFCPVESGGIEVIVIDVLDSLLFRDHASLQESRIRGGQSADGAVVASQERSQELADQFFIHPGAVGRTAAIRGAS